MKSYSEKELSEELSRRKNAKQLEKVKSSLLNLKAVPHLRETIEKYEKYITCADDISFINKLDDLRNKSLLHKNSCSIFYQLQYFVKGCKVNWIDADKIVYNKCSKCDNYEILQYQENKLLQVEVSLIDGFGSEAESTFVDCLCEDCRNFNTQLLGTSWR